MEGELWKVDGGEQEGLRGGVCRRSFIAELDGRVGLSQGEGARGE